MAFASNFRRTKPAGFNHGLGFCEFFQNSFLLIYVNAVYKTRWGGTKPQVNITFVTRYRC